MTAIEQYRLDGERLRAAGIRPTGQRMGVMRAIREGGRRHLTPESFHRELADADLKMSLATVYNTLNHFADAGLLRRVGVGDRTWFCTNTTEHHHFFDEVTGRIEDVLGDQPTVIGLPPPPPGMSILGVDVVIRVRRI
ncbi:MAG: transcriptional repressor [Magnetospirillum sp.]|nr:MAG: transcriptional repressor [Magnetospirillum sp.]